MLGGASSLLVKPVRPNTSPWPSLEPPQRPRKGASEELRILGASGTFPLPRSTTSHGVRPVPAGSQRIPRRPLDPPTLADVGYESFVQAEAAPYRRRPTKLDGWEVAPGTPRGTRRVGTPRLAERLASREVGSCGAKEVLLSELHVLSPTTDTYRVLLFAPGARRSDLFFGVEKGVLRVSNAPEPTARDMLTYAVDEPAGVRVYSHPSAHARCVGTHPLGARLRGYAPVHFWVALAMGEGWVRVGEGGARPGLRPMGREPFSFEECAASSGFARYLSLPADADPDSAVARMEPGGVFTLTFTKRTGSRPPTPESDDAAARLAGLLAGSSTAAAGFSFSRAAAGGAAAVAPAGAPEGRPGQGSFKKTDTQIFGSVDPDVIEAEDETFDAHLQSVYGSSHAPSQGASHADTPGQLRRLSLGDADGVPGSIVLQGEGYMKRRLSAGGTTILDSVAGLQVTHVGGGDAGNASRTSTPVTAAPSPSPWTREPSPAPGPALIRRGGR